MPQVDLETLMSACAGGSSDRKIVCEMLAGDVEDGEQQPPPDFPPESFWLSKDAEFDWFDRNAFYERKESAKGNTIATHLNPSTDPVTNPPSQRFSTSVKSKRSIIGLPKTQKTNYNIDLAKGKNYKPANILLFPKRSASMEKSAGQTTEPSSPKVSCIGRVRSKRKNRKRSESSRKPVEKVRTNGDRSNGIYKHLKSLFRSKRRSKLVATSDAQETVESTPRKSVPAPAVQLLVELEALTDPPRLGGMKRFSSGRKSSSSAVDVAE